jgi:hypothetical protein
LGAEIRPTDGAQKNGQKIRFFLVSSGRLGVDGVAQVELVVLVNHKKA